MGRRSNFFRYILWGVPSLVMITDSIVSINLVNDDGMHPTMQRGDLVIVDKLSSQRLQSGQIVQIRNPEASRGASDMKLVRRLDYRPESRYKGHYFLKDYKQSEYARDSDDFGPVPEAIILGKVAAVIFPPWRARWIEKPPIFKQIWNAFH